jgi:hypothetical protein
MTIKLFFLLIFHFLYFEVNAQNLSINTSIGTSLFFNNFLELPRIDKIYVTPRPSFALDFDFFYKKIGIRSGLQYAKGTSAFQISQEPVNIVEKIPAVYLDYNCLQIPILLTGKIPFLNKKITFRPYLGLNVVMIGGFKEIPSRYEIFYNGQSAILTYEIYIERGFFPVFASNLGIGIDYKITPKVFFSANVFSSKGYKRTLSYWVGHTVVYDNVASPTWEGIGFVTTKSDQYIFQFSFGYWLF